MIQYGRVLGCNLSQDVPLSSPDRPTVERFSFMEHWKNYSLENLTQVIDGITYAEEWKTIESYPLYDVSTFGRVKSRNKGTVKILHIREITHPQRTTINKYISASLSKLGQTKNNAYVHRLVALSFIPPKENCPMVNHKDGVKCNNFYLNLEWCTNGENQEHAYKTKARLKTVGEAHGKTTLTEIQILKIREIYNSKTHPSRKLAKLFGVDPGTILNIVKRKTWKHV